MVPTPNVPATSAVTVKKSYKFFNENLEMVSKEVEVSFTPADNTADAMSRLGNNDALILKALNASLLRATVSEARKAALSGGISKKILLEVIKPLRALPMYAIDENLTGTAKTEARRKQTEVLLTMVKQNSMLLEAIKSASASVDDDDEDSADESGE